MIRVIGVYLLLLFRLSERTSWRSSCGCWSLTITTNSKPHVASSHVTPLVSFLSANSTVLLLWSIPSHWMPPPALLMLEMVYWEWHPNQEGWLQQRVGTFGLEEWEHRNKRRRPKATKQLYTRKWWGALVTGRAALKPAPIIYLYRNNRAKRNWLYWYCGYSNAHGISLKLGKLIVFLCCVELCCKTEVIFALLVVFYIARKVKVPRSVCLHSAKGDDCCDFGSRVFLVIFCLEFVKRFFYFGLY